jgi:hypothetical protein
MDLLQKLTNELDAEINRVYTEYIELHKELDQHRGKPLGDTNLEEVNRLLKEIQERFASLYPAYHFIAARNQYVNNAVNSYNEFIETIKKAGAQQLEEAKS